MTNNSVQRRRTVRSYARRQGRLTSAQRRALAELWPVYGLSFGAGALDMNSVFGREAPCIVEIGFGMGDSLASLAAQYPANNYLGIEVYEPGIGSLLRQLAANGTNNVRIIREDAQLVLTQMIGDETLAAVYLFFPDPWPKKRHHKRRLVQSAFLELAGRKLRRGGVFHMATDWQHYAEQMCHVAAQSDLFCNIAGTGNFSPRPDYRPLTRFEQRGQRLGHAVYDLVLLRI